MQVSTESLGPLKRQVSVEIPEERIVSQVRKRLGSLSRTSRLDGFRPGKVPLKVLERRFGSRVRNEVVGEIVRESLQEALESEQLRVAGTPTIEPLDDIPGQGLKYTATFEILPEVSLAPVEDLNIERPSCEITEADVDAMIETLRSQHRLWEPVDRAAAAGDRLRIDFSGLVDGAAFDGGAAEDFHLELGSHALVEGFEDGLLGAKAGEQRALDVEFPEDYSKSELAGRPVHFDVTVKEVAESRLPELDAELFGKFGVTEGGLDAFRAEVRENMEREAEQALGQRTKQIVFDAVRESNPIDIPESLVASESERLLQETRQRLAMQGVQAEQLQNLQADGFAETAEKRVALGLLMAEIVKQGGLSADPGKVRAAVETIAASYEEPTAVIKWYYEEPGRLANIESSVLEQAVVDWILERAKVTDSPISFDALMNPGQTES